MSNITFDNYDNKIYEKLLYTNGFFALTIGGLGIYMTLFWSPKIFGAYKYFLFNIAVWAYMFDVYAIFLYFPWFLYPAILNCPIGILKSKSHFWVQVWYNIGISIMTGTSIAVLSAFIYRYALLKNKVNTMLNWKFLTVLGFLQLFNQAPNWVFLRISTSNVTLVSEMIVKVRIITILTNRETFSALP